MGRAGPSLSPWPNQQLYLRILFFPGLGGTGVPTLGQPLDMRRPVVSFAFSHPCSPPRGFLPFPVRSQGGRVQTLALPDTFVLDRGLTGRPQDLCQGMWALRSAVFTRARVRAPCPEGRFFLSSNKQLSPQERSSSYPHNLPKPQWRVGLCEL